MKTPVYIVRPRRPRGKHRMIPGFINGDLADRSRKGLTKVFVYHFDSAGDLVMTVMAVRYVQPAVFELEG